jgi:type II secretory pathway pseudopilin PulG
MRTSERGFSYLLLLFMLLLSGVALAALGENLGVGRQREREAELLWRGTEIARALDRYRAVAVNGASRYPTTLEELVDDRRLADPRYHLRRLYQDPYSGRADWALLRDEQGGIVGVHSRSSALALARVGVPLQASEARAEDPGLPAAGKEPRVSLWHFMAGATVPASPSTVPVRSPR